ncbi:MAG: glutathione S-transferase domain-containing protein [Myxococcales bacterium]|nr:MAG: glutathione S-transferase domain-containing protein [Myxococcales bacterium]
MVAPALTLVGRSSSHFTRVTRFFASELGVPYAFEVVTDLRALDDAAYRGNPALRLPSLIAPSGTWYGSLNICRELARLAPRSLRLVWPEQLEDASASNLQELTLQAMSTEVELIMNDAPESALATKRRESLLGTLRWLDANVDAALGRLPPRDLSYLEVALYCLVTHLDFRHVVPTAPYERLRTFVESFGEREGARATPFVFDR